MSAAGKAGVHGHQSTYKGGCRCDECRTAHADYARERGYNRRVGARGDSKRRADAKLRHPCATDGCEKLVDRRAVLCRPCRVAAQREQARPRRELVERLWRDGVSSSEIAAVLGIRMFPSGVYRQQGYDLPYRRTPEQVARITAGTRASVRARSA